MSTVTRSIRDSGSLDIERLIDGLRSLQKDVAARHAATGAGPWEISVDPAGSAIAVQAAGLEMMLLAWQARK